MPLEDGTTVFVDTGADIKPGDPGYFEERAGKIKGAAFDVIPFYGPTTGRIVTLNQDHKEAVRAGKSILVEDIDARSRTLGEAAPHIDEIEAKLQSGEIKDTGEALEVFNTKVSPMRKDAAGAVMDGVGDASLFPQSETVRRMDAARIRAEALRAGTVPEEPAPSPSPVPEEPPPSPSPVPGNIISVTNTDADTQSRFLKRLFLTSLPSRVEATGAQVIDPVGAVEDTVKKISAVRDSIESGNSLEDVKTALMNSMNSPEAMADFYVDMLTLLLTRNPRFSNTKIDEYAIASNAAQNIPGTNLPDEKYIPGAILAAALRRTNKRVKDENERDFGTPTSGRPKTAEALNRPVGAVVGTRKKKESN
jgi:hypothetical protein